MVRWSLFVIFFALSAISPTSADADANVVKLSKFNFESLVGQGHWFIKFYAPWCSFCKKMAPTWVELADTQAKYGQTLRIGEFDCTTATDFCKDLQVTGYPTLLFFSKGQKMHQFKVTGSLTHDTLLDWAKSKLLEQGVDLEKAQQGDQGDRRSGPEYRTGLFSFLKFWPTQSFLVNVYLLISFMAFFMLFSCWCAFAWMYHTDENEDEEDDRPAAAAPKENKKEL